MAGYPREMPEVREALSRRPRESHGGHPVRVKPHSLALELKLADLRENPDESRIPEPTKEDLRLWEKSASNGLAARQSATR